MLVRTSCRLLRRPPGAPTVIEALPSPLDPLVVTVKLEKPLYNNGRGELGLEARRRCSALTPSRWMGAAAEPGRRC